MIIFKNLPKLRAGEGERQMNLLLTLLSKSTNSSFSRFLTPFGMTEKVILSESDPSFAVALLRRMEGSRG